MLHWTNLLLFVLIVPTWFIWAQKHGLLLWSGVRSDLPPWHSLLLHLAWWFPAVFLVLPGFVLRPRKILRPDEVTLADRLPFAWLFVGVLVELLFAQEPSAAMVSTPAFALAAACAWQRTARPLRALGIILAFIAGGIFAAIVWFHPATAATVLPKGLDDEIWLSLRPLAQIAIASLIVGAVAALIFLRQRSEITLVAAVAAMVPIGACLVEGRSRVAPFFSLAKAADYLDPRLGRNGEVIYEGSVRSGSSLAFYLDKKFFLVNEAPPAPDAASQRRYLDEHFVLEAWDRSDPLYLIIDENRVTHWRRLITDRVHIYHQVTTCGSRVVLSNQM
jgi:hypothetical protein